MTSKRPLSPSLFFALALSAGCGGEPAKGITATQGEVEIPLAVVECSGTDHPTLAPLCGKVFQPMTWERTDTPGIMVTIGESGQTQLEIEAVLPEEFDPESDYAAEVTYVATLRRDSDSDELSGNLSSETVVPSCSGGRFRAAGSLLWQEERLGISWEAYPDAGCSTPEQEAAEGSQ